jgi:hypothetical protein
MAKQPANHPIMSAEAERFMAFMGLIQWTQAVISQSERVEQAQRKMRDKEGLHDAAQRQERMLAMHTECHFFSVAAYKLIEHRSWVRTFGLCETVDFSKVDQFSVKDIRDLRNMREHVVDYFQGSGHAKERWVVETPEFSADASSIAGTLIGGRLDWVAFSAVAKDLLRALLAEPIPYPSLDADL